MSVVYSEEEKTNSAEDGTVTNRKIHACSTIHFRYVRLLWSICCPWGSAEENNFQSLGHTVHRPGDTCCVY